ncbi:putative metallopeptidase [Sporomusa sphaeroides]|uniref:Putative phage metallopeptidase domain-containing protein n=1 Tax=Sporomusa sphaeroides DSM 2875 TaxID=1337886 RepID=A0ABM9W396_9FIRM|nr:putative metallopeptidase [Sporomusa sphaeroides]OLS56395.1 hypothetical protein SPSPH_27880 [Sporomusa sphaeroides DSM 2875]CVK18490.1 hypothetical protein SSPH_01128 [Sporomusa sphaeroides DSM 2875]
MARKSFKPPKEKTGYEYAPEAITVMAARLIDDHHGHLAEAKIAYLMRTGSWQKKGSPVDADVQVISGANRFMMDETVFRVIINAKVWEKVDEKTRMYILDKQLSRCEKNSTAAGDVRWSLRDYQIKEFASLIKRHGLVTDDLKRLDQALKQTELEFNKEQEAENTTDTAPADEQPASQDGAAPAEESDTVF